MCHPDEFDADHAAPKVVSHRRRNCFIAGGGILLASMSGMVSFFLFSNTTNAVADDATEKEKRAYLDFLARKLPDTDGVQLISWQSAGSQQSRTTWIKFSDKRTTGNKLWVGMMTIQEGQIASKWASHAGTSALDPGRFIVEKAEP